MELQDGGLKLSFDFGSGVGRLVGTKNNYNDGKPHAVYVHRLERHARMQVDGDDIAEGDSPGTMFELGVSDVFYLGGVPSDVSTYVFLTTQCEATLAVPTCQFYVDQESNKCTWLGVNAVIG